MTPTKIDTTEKTFATSLKDSNGVTHSLINKIDIGEGCQITQIRPNFNSYYYTNETKKTAICLHFTVGNLKGDIGSLAKKDNKVSVQYVVDRQGNIYNLFDDKYWSYHLGSNCVGTNGTMSKQTIGIEISNYRTAKVKW
jgi:N-acetyl-anhydromuramyl-L-alanine amidase AmpD